MAKSNLQQVAERIHKVKEEVAVQDDDFRAALMRDPTAALGGEYGLEPSCFEKLSIRVEVENPNELVIVIPSQAAGDELSEDQLEAVAGGAAFIAGVAAGAAVISAVAAPATIPGTTVPVPTPAAPPPQTAVDPPSAAVTDGVSSDDARTGVNTTLGPVAAGDTLWSLAAQHRPARQVSVPQMMNALMRANPELFPSEDPAQLAEGTTLRLPTRAEIEAAAP